MWRALGRGWGGVRRAGGVDMAERSWMMEGDGDGFRVAMGGGEGRRWEMSYESRRWLDGNE